MPAGQPLQVQEQAGPSVASRSSRTVHRGSAGGRKRRRENQPGVVEVRPSVVDLTEQPDSDPDEVVITGERQGPPRLIPGLSMHNLQGVTFPHNFFPPSSSQAASSSHGNRAAVLLRPEAHRPAGLQAPTWEQQAPVAPPSPDHGGIKCPICLDNIEDMSTTTCGHVFCTACITDAIKALKKCPKCRKGLTMKSIHKIFLDQ